MGSKIKLRKIIISIISGGRFSSAYFTAFFFLIAFMDVKHWFRSGDWQVAVYLTLFDVLISFAATVLTAIIKSVKIRRNARIILIVLAGFWAFVDIFCIIQYHSPFDSRFAGVCLGTNFNEFVEFVVSYLSFGVVFRWLFVVVMTAVVYLLMRKYYKDSKTGRTLLAIVASVGIVALAFNGKIFKETFIGQILQFFTIETAPDLRKYRHSPQVSVNDSIVPDHVVLIIGESLSNSHCSLNGYDKETQPLLGKLVREGNAVVFSKAESPATHTVEAFKRIMTTYGDGSRKKWYEHLNVPELFRAAGFSTSWISNQAKFGLFDNVPSSFSTLCDEERFTSDKFLGIRRIIYDGELIPILKERLKIDASRSFTIVHMMGSHTQFNKRYPESFGKFKESDYLLNPENQRGILADYDNSVLYNDYVVSSMIKLLEEENAIIVYLPDHGYDVFESSPDFVGHGIAYDSASVRAAVKIPVLIYFSTPYLESHPGIRENIMRQSEKPFNSTHLINLLSQLAGITLHGC